MFSKYPIYKARSLSTCRYCFVISDILGLNLWNSSPPCWLWTREILKLYPHFWSCPIHLVVSDKSVSIMASKSLESVSFLWLIEKLEVNLATQKLVFQKLVSETGWNHKDQGCKWPRKSSYFEKNLGEPDKSQGIYLKERNVMENSGKLFITLIKMFTQDHTKRITSFCLWKL